MNFRFFYIALVLVFSYMLFFSWNQESKQKQELAESSYIEQIKEDPTNPVKGLIFTISFLLK